MHQQEITKIQAYCPQCGRYKKDFFLKPGQTKGSEDIKCKCKREVHLSKISKFIELTIGRVLYIKDYIEGIPGQITKKNIRCPKCKIIVKKFIPALSIKNMPCPNSVCDAIGMDIDTTGNSCIVTASGVINH